jgi:hypothetical protein
MDREEAYRKRLGEKHTETQNSSKTRALPPAMVGDSTGSVLALRAGSKGTDFHLNVMAQLKLPRTMGDAPYCKKREKSTSASLLTQNGFPNFKCRVVNEVNDWSYDVGRIIFDTLK